MFIMWSHLAHWCCHRISGVEGLKRSGQEVATFHEMAANFQQRRLCVLRIFILLLNSPKLGISSLKFGILLKGNFLMWRTFSDMLQFWGQMPLPAPSHYSLTHPSPAATWLCRMCYDFNRLKPLDVEVMRQIHYKETSGKQFVFHTPNIR